MIAQVNMGGSSRQHRPRAVQVFILSFGVLAGLAGCRSASSRIPCPFGPDSLSSRSENVTFQIDNQSCTTICRIYLGAPSCDDWGSDLLLDGQERVPDGSSTSFQIPPGKYDLLIEDCTETGYQMTNLDLRESTNWTFSLEGRQAGQACDAALTVVNESTKPVCHMWVAGEQSESFGNNWLRNDDTIPAGGEMTFVVIPGTYDIKAEDCDFIPLRVELDLSVIDHQVWRIP